MPNKRNRKDSTSSQVGSSGSTGSSAGEDLVESCTSKICCIPGNPGCAIGDVPFADSWVKVTCSNENCTIGEFMHSHCFNAWENALLGFLKSQGRARNWSEKQRRQNLWSKKGYDIAYKATLCKCRKGYLKKDTDFTYQGGVESGDAKQKKNRKKNKDLPMLASNNNNSAAGGVGGGKNQSQQQAITPMQRSKSKPIPNSSHARIRTNSTSSAISLDQGYISSSPCTAPGANGEYAAHILSPQSTPWSTGGGSGGRYNPVILQRANVQAGQVPSTSPLPEVDGAAGISGLLADNDEGLLTTTCGSPFFTPSPASHGSLISGNGYSPPFSPDQQQQRGYYTGRNLHTLKEQSTDEYDHQRQLANIFPPMQPNDIEYELQRSLHLDDSPKGSGQQFGSEYMQHQHGIAKEMKMHEEREMEQRKLEQANKQQNARKQQQQVNAGGNGAAAGGGRTAKSLTEIKMVPLRHTVFKQRFDFSVFQKVLPRMNVNPYHIKMEGEGYGSDDLRNFILSSLSLASCSEMNCVVCGIDMPVYDHFPLVDGTMFLSPERNERSTRRAVKISVEGKNEYVHAACLKCLEGFHNIVCRFCDSRWQGSHHQLGTLYMFDIFAAEPCCQARLSCKNCNNSIVDHRVGLKNFSDYSRKRQCQYCMVVDHHFVRSIASTFQIKGPILDF